MLARYWGKLNSNLPPPPPPTSYNTIRSIWCCNPFYFLFLLSSFLLSVLRHIVRVYETSTLHSEDDYYLREDGEIPTQVFPNFPILRERAVFTRDCNIQDQKQQKDSCQKDFPSHSKLQGCIWWLADAQTRLFMGSQWCHLVKSLQCCLIWF